MTHDVGTNIDFMEFCTAAKMLGITCHSILVEAHWSISKVDKYHAPIRRAYEIIHEETQSTISKIVMLQIAFKAVNNITNPDILV